MTLQDRKTLLINYLKMKVDEQDWHGVADAAMDLRELEVEIRLGGGVFSTELKSLITPPTFPDNRIQKEGDIASYQINPHDRYQR